MPVIKKPDHCRSCSLFGNGMGFSKWEGSGSIGVAAMAESLGENEEFDGLPLRPFAQAGSIFTRAIKRASTENQPLDRSMFMIGNTVWCRPPDNKLEYMPYYQNAVDMCAKHRRTYLDAFKLACDARPESVKLPVILAMGNVPFKTMTGISGKKQSVTYLRGFPRMLDNGMLCLPTFHPAYVARNRKLIGVLVHDILKAVAYAREGYTQFPTRYLPNPTEEQVRDIRDRCLNPKVIWNGPDQPWYGLSWDIETMDIASRKEWPAWQSIQFSLGPGDGMFLDVNADTLPVIAEILASPISKAGHNCFARNTSVWMADGTWKPIWKVGIGDYVKSRDTNGLIVARRVADSVHVKNADPWLSVIVDGAHNRGVGRHGGSGIVCTKDHVWLTEGNSRRRADMLKPGDVVKLPRQGAYDMLFGSMLGDGHIRKDEHRFACGHTNHGWAQAKARNLDVKLTEEVAKRGYRPGTKSWKVTAAVPGRWRDMFYHLNGTRKWSPPPSMRALAVWYGDDGCLAHPERGGSITLSLHKYTHCIDQVRAWFESNFGLTSIHNDAVLYLHKESSEKFCLAVREFLDDSMSYKLPEEHRGFYNGWMAKPESQIGWVLGVYPIEPPHAADKYCLGVTDTHTFFTRGGLVANCWRFDERVMRERYKLTINGRSDDTMWLFHHWEPDLTIESGKEDAGAAASLSTRAGLQFASSFFGMDFAWKHLNDSEPRFYGIADVDAVSRIMTSLPFMMRSYNIWHGYERLVRGNEPILMNMMARGLPINNSGRLELHDALVKERKAVDIDLQALYPEHLKSLDPKEGLTNEPKEGPKIRKVYLV